MICSMISIYSTCHLKSILSKKCAHWFSKKNIFLYTVKLQGDSLHKILLQNFESKNIFYFEYVYT